MAPVCPVAPVLPVLPLAPVNESAHVNFLVKLLPSTTIGIVNSPPLVVNVVAAVTIKLAAVVPLEEEGTLVVKPVTCPVIVPIVAAICVVPL